MTDIRKQLRRLGVSKEAIARATINGKPLAEALKPRPGRRPPLKHDLADMFCELWRRFGPDIPPQREYRFHPTRRWRFDVAWPEHKVAVELEGGVWTLGRHTRGKGYCADMQKYNAAIELGWRVVRFAANDLDFAPVQTIEKVKSLLEGIDAPNV